MATVTANIPTRKKSDIRKVSLPYLYLLPAFAVMAVITFYPLIYQMIVSFTDFQTKDLRFRACLSTTPFHWSKKLCGYLDWRLARSKLRIFPSSNLQLLVGYHQCDGPCTCWHHHCRIVEYARFMV